MISVSKFYIAICICFLLIPFGCSESGEPNKIDRVGNLNEGDVLMYQYFDGVVQGDEFYVFEDQKELDTLLLEVVSVEEDEISLVERFDDDAASWKSRFTTDQEDYSYFLKIGESDLEVVPSGSNINESTISPFWLGNVCGSAPLSLPLVDDYTVFVGDELQKRWWAISDKHDNAGRLSFFTIRDRGYVNAFYSYRNCEEEDQVGVMSLYQKNGVPLVSYAYDRSKGNIYGFQLLGWK